MGIGGAISTWEDLVPRLDRLVSLLEEQIAQSTSELALSRSKLNGTLLTSTVILGGAAGNWSWDWDSTVPFASVGFSDSLSLGPYVISTDAQGAGAGVGTYNVATGASGEIPLMGTHLSIRSTAAIQPKIFVAVFTMPLPLRIN